MNEVYSKDSVDWLKYDNFMAGGGTHVNEERTVLRKWIRIKID